MTRAARPCMCPHTTIYAARARIRGDSRARNAAATSRCARQQRQHCAALGMCAEARARCRCVCVCVCAGPTGHMYLCVRILLNCYYTSVLIILYMRSLTAPRARERASCRQDRLPAAPLCRQKWFCRSCKRAARICRRCATEDTHSQPPVCARTRRQQPRLRRATRCRSAQVHDLKKNKKNVTYMRPRTTTYMCINWSVLVPPL